MMSNFLISKVYDVSEGEDVANSGAEISENDYIIIYGECNGTQNTTTVLGKQVTLPYVNIEYIE